MHKALDCLVRDAGVTQTLQDRFGLLPVTGERLDGARRTSFQVQGDDIRERATDINANRDRHGRSVLKARRDSVGRPQSRLYVSIRMGH